MAEKILIIDDDVDTLRLVGLMLQKQGYQILAAADGMQGLSTAETENPDVIILDVMMPEMDGYEVSRRLRENSFTSHIPILMFTAKTQLDDKVTGFEAGADDYLTKPTHPSELIAHVKALLARTAKGKQASQPLVSKAYTVGIIAPRGGLGATTVAVNLGSALVDATGTEVIVAELRPGQGTLALDFGEPASDALTQLLQLPPKELTRQAVLDRLYNHPSDLRILFGSTKPLDAGMICADAQFELIVKRLAQLCSYLVLDIGPGLTPLSQKLLGFCNQVIVVVEPVLNSVLHTKALISDLVDMGRDKQTILAVLVNRIRSDIHLNWTQVQERVEHPIPVAFTPAPELLYQAVRTKTTVVASVPDSLTGQQFEKLSNLIVERSKQGK